MIQLPTFNETLHKAVQVFRASFDDEPNVAACGPGRVNLIGEHIDYNDGFVLPVALPFTTIMVGKKRTDTLATIVTCCEGADGARLVTFDTKNVTKGLPKWANYVKGILHYYCEDLNIEYGFNAVINTNVPIGGGLSSSAALEVSTLIFLEELLGQPKKLNLTDKALLCQKTEHNFVGMPCGIMDQLISVMGQQNHALLIDCLSLDTKLIPFKSNDIAILICNSNVKHELSDSEYPQRRQQCADALKVIGVKSYRAAQIGDIERLKSNDLLYRRARHVITEIERTAFAAGALKKNDFKTVGKLMIASHNSLRDDYNVSCDEIDFLVDELNKCAGVLGSRMTGGGFGGCTVTLVEKSCVDSVVATVQKRYKENLNKVADFYVCEPSEGARAIEFVTM